MMRIRLAEFSQFRDTYPAAVDSLRFVTSTAIKGGILQANQSNTFIGILSPEQSPDPIFIVIMDLIATNQVRNVQQDIMDRYHQTNISVLPYEARSAFFQNVLRTNAKGQTQQNEHLQQLLPKMEIITWHGLSDEEYPLFTDIDQAIDTIAQI